MTETYDPFAPDTGLKEAFDGEIVEAAFTQAGDANRWGLDLTILASDEEVVKIRLGVGKDWQSVDGGESVVGASSRSRFHPQTAYYRWTQAAMRAGAEKVLRGRSDEWFENRGPQHAGLWDGLKFHFDVVEGAGRTFDEGKGEWVPGPAIQPVKFIGVSQEEEAPKPTPAAAPKSGGRRATPPASTSTSGEISEADMTTLKSLAVANPTYEDFADAVMEAGFGRNKAVLKAMADESWYEGLK